MTGVPANTLFQRMFKNNSELMEMKKIDGNSFTPTEVCFFRQSHGRMKRRMSTHPVRRLPFPQALRFVCRMLAQRQQGSHRSRGECQALFLSP